MTNEDAASLARDLAALLKKERAPREYPWVTAERIAQWYESRIDSEPTDPRAVLIRECPSCGASVPTAWTPPDS